jgi:hypothetical protein
LSFKDVLLGEEHGFGFVKDPYYLADPGSRYVCVVLMPLHVNAAGVKLLPFLSTGN